MQIQPSREDNILSINVTGRIDGLTANEFESAVTAEIGNDDRGVVIGLSDLSYISSAGLRSILMIAKTLGQKKVGFALYEVPDSILEIIKIAGFDRIIDVVNSREDALARIG